MATATATAMAMATVMATATATTWLVNRWSTPKWGRPAVDQRMMMMMMMMMTRDSLALSHSWFNQPALLHYGSVVAGDGICSRIGWWRLNVIGKSSRTEPRTSRPTPRRRRSWPRLLMLMRAGARSLRRPSYGSVTCSTRQQHQPLERRGTLLGQSTALDH